MDRQYRYVVVQKLEQLVSWMQNVETGVTFRSQKLFLTSIPAAVSGNDIIAWVAKNISCDDMNEANHLANMMCSNGYIYPLTDYKSHLVKDDPTVLYRFQAPYFWLSKVFKPDAMDYAIYLVKRTMRGRQKYSLEEYEQIALEKLQKMLCDKWEFIYMQAEEQVRLGKERKKGDRIVIDAQERAFWRIHRPPPGRSCKVEEGGPRNITASQLRLRMAVKAKKSKSSSSEPQTSNKHSKENGLSLPSNNQSDINKTPTHGGPHARSTASKALDNLITFQSNFAPFDYFLTSSDNPWLSTDQEAWPFDSEDSITPKRARMWQVSFDALLRDPVGRRCLEHFLGKEFSGENLKFWIEVNNYKFGPVKNMPERSQELFKEYLSSDASTEINIDSRTMAITERELKSPSRFTFEEAQEHIYNLMKKDSYARFLRSEDYALCLQSNPSNSKGSKKKTVALWSTSGNSTAPNKTKSSPSAQATFKVKPVDQSDAETSSNAIKLTDWEDPCVSGTKSPPPPTNQIAPWEEM